MLPDLDIVLNSLGHGTPASAFESDHLEFKEPADSVKKTLAILAETAVCLSNAEGGIIVLGVRDDATTRGDALVGVDARHYPTDHIRRGIFERTAPPLTLLAEERLVDGVRLVILRVPAGVTIHSTSAGLATRRLGHQCVPFTPEEQREVLAARGYHDWSAEASAESLGRVSAAQLDRLRRRLVTGGHQELAQLRDRHLLDALGLIRADGRLTNAAVVLLLDDDSLRRALPTYGYSYQYRPSPGREPTNRFRGNRPLLEALELILDAVQVRSELEPLDVRGAQQLQLIDYPPRAVRELLVNAFVHRSYESYGTVDVEQSPEHLTISSPGGLVAGVTPQNILVHASAPRNYLLTDVISRLQIAERTGQGVDRAYREMLRVGKQPPGFLSDHDVRVVVRGGIGNASFARFISELEPDLASDVEVLLALSALRTRPSLTAVRLADLIQRSPVEAEEVLRGLAEDQPGVLEPTRRTARQRFPSYRLRSRPLAQLGRAVAYGTRGLDGADTKIIEHVREFGYVTNASLQRMFDIHVFAARDLLNTLRRRDILEKLDEARAGKGVRYGPGPAFPSNTRSRSKSD
jgi:ATP-dependent DNA helicase RecG